VPFQSASASPDEYFLFIAPSQLGKGAFAKVFVGIERVTRNEYAVKQIDRSKMRWNGRDALQDEIGNLTKLRNAPNIVYLHECFLEEKLCYMVLELLPGKALFQRLIQKGTFSEEEARNSCRCVLYALAYMHERRMTHRDLKPDNLLLAVSRDVRLNAFVVDRFLGLSLFPVAIGRT
jgi:serine/threonine protein kinase